MFLHPAKNAFQTFNPNIFINQKDFFFSYCENSEVPFRANNNLESLEKNSQLEFYSYYYNYKLLL